MRRQLSLFAVTMSVALCLLTIAESAVAPPTAPNQFILTALSRSIRLNWTNRATDAVGYRIFRTTMKAGSQSGKTIALGANAIQYIDWNLEKTQAYCYCIVCYNAGGESIPEVCGCAKTLK